uniref:uracil-DNA glycosylase-like n=1 Tax=Styela clava TaxID=7725 RepID=UPI001939C843|nr:uracil-DNA glycosylase-like [Styela clava]
MNSMVAYFHMRLMMDKYHARFMESIYDTRFMMEKDHMRLMLEIYKLRLMLENYHMCFMESPYNMRFMIEHYQMRFMIEHRHMLLMMSNYHMCRMMKKLEMSNYHLRLMVENYQNPSMMPEYTDLRFRYLSTVEESWKPVLASELYEQYFINLCDFLTKEKEEFGNTIYPPEEEVFAWTQYCGIQHVKVVIIGQDPYHEEGEAHGLSFSVKDLQTLPPSLTKIYKELKTNIRGFEPPNHGDLTSWAKQGVLLLNSCLTVRDGEAGSHKNKGWEVFTDAVIRHLNDNYSGIVFMLWGVPAQMKKCFINEKKHLVLCCGHPVYNPRANSDSVPFKGCKHFLQANEYLFKHSIDGGINWTLPPVPLERLGQSMLQDTFVQPGSLETQFSHMSINPAFSGIF